jgi:hypothetical protein
MGDFEIEGWDEFVKAFAGLVDKWDEKKKVLLGRIGAIMEAEILPLIPVDTSRLAGSFSIEVGGDYVAYGTNVEYALYVNDGHVQHKRFLPVSAMSANGGKNYKKYLSKNNQKGIMLKERYVAGKHYIERGMDKAMPRIETLIVSFMEQLYAEAEGGKL